MKHNILINKLYCYGVRGLPQRWFSSYLENRSQCVKVGYRVSEMRRVYVGVPQGSIIGPLLYLCYVNDLPNVYGQFSTVLYAYDTTFTVSDPDYDNLLQTINIDLKMFG